MECGSLQTFLDKLVAMLSLHFSADESCHVDANLNLCRASEWNIQFTEIQVQNQLKRLSTSKSPGSDGIPTKIYCYLADFIAKPLCTIFNSSVSSASFPKEWKKCLIVPIPKTNPPDIKKLRYISLLPAPSKVMERLVLRTMWKHFQSAYGMEQHGFRPCASSTTALIQTVNDATQAYDNANIFGVALLSYDLSQALDCINHADVVNTFIEKGFSTEFSRWIGD